MAELTEKWVPAQTIANLFGLAESTVYARKAGLGAIRRRRFGRAVRFWLPDALALQRRKLVRLVEEPRRKKSVEMSRALLGRASR